MAKEFEDLKKALEAGVEPASDDARKAAMNAAMDAFDEKNSPARQGNSQPVRQTKQGNTLVTRFSNWRKQMKLSYALAGSASVAVLALAVVNTGQLQTYFKDVTLETAQLETKPQTERTIGAAKKDARTEAKKRIVGQLKSPSGGVDADAAPVTAAPPSPPKIIGQFAANQPQRRVLAKRKVRPLADQIAPPGYRVEGRDRFDAATPNPLKLTQKESVSTFSIDVDTASYSFMRASLNRNVLPPKAAVRVEELINYFPYNYPGPDSREVPFKTNVTVLPSPWNAKTKLVHIGIKGYQVPQVKKPKANLVFLLDTSGSMNAPNKLPLLKNSFKLLLSSLSPDDTVSIVAYAGSAGVVLEPTKVADKRKILNALERLSAGGSTAGGEGIRLAYQLAETNFDKTGINRVILATDGDFNVGIANKDELKGFVERKRRTGVQLSVLGFGRGNYNDALMQALAQNGNGNAAYIDNLNEARKVLVEEAASTLLTIAGDVKIQMEFNPATVKAWRLIGYETRALKRTDFNNDKVDAGDIGSGHTVTAIYEITPVGVDAGQVDALRYKKKPAARTDETGGEFGFLKLRYKLPGQTKSQLIKTAVRVDETLGTVADAPRDVRFASAVALYGQLLRGGTHTGEATYDDVIKLALQAKGEDKFGYRAEFINLVRLAKSAAALQQQRTR